MSVNWLKPPEEWAEQLQKSLSTKLWSQGAEHDANQLSDKFYLS